MNLSILRKIINKPFIVELHKTGHDHPLASHDLYLCLIPSADCHFTINKTLVDIMQ